MANLSILGIRSPSNFLILSKFVSTSLRILKLAPLSLTGNLADNVFTKPIRVDGSSSRRTDL